MKEKTEKLRNFLLDTGLLSKEQYQTVEKEANERGLAVEDILVERGIVSDEQLGELIADFFEVPFINLKDEKIPDEIRDIVPEIVAREQKIIVFDKTKGGLKVAMTNPNNIEMISWLEKKTGEKVIPYYATTNGIKEALRLYKKDIKRTFEEILKKGKKRAEIEKIKTREFPIIKIVDTLIEYAYENRASDIHIEPLEKKTKIRFRIDGVLHNVIDLPKKIHESLVSRVKVLAKLRTDEHFAAQDGKFVVKLGGEKFDVRVSVVPVTEGENVVMRILSERVRRFRLEDLGLSDKDLKIVKEATKNPFGMILATGPTGCGKTTTLYSILKILNKPGVNICTIEDPVEYDIEGVSQIQVNPKANITFARGLRAIVRQDPDIIMVGEIRDNETAKTAINSAMTGHLVLSSMHANTAATNLPRLIDIGIEPFLIASSINVIIAQRLVRKICTRCRESHELTKEELKRLNIPKQIIEKISKKRKKNLFYRGKGCKACTNTGYSGRIGIFEVLNIDENIQKLIMQKSDADRIKDQAIKNGMTTMLEDGMEKALVGITTIEEIIRVIHE